MKIQNPAVNLALAAALAVAGGNALAQDKAKAPDKAKSPLAGEGRGVGEVVRVTSTVESVDQATRTVTLKQSNGETTTFVAGPEVRNLAQVAKGDVVTIEYAQALAVKLAKTTATTRERSVVEGMERAEPGQKPGGVAIRQVKVVASVEKIDTAKNMVTLRGPQNTVDLKVQDPANLKGLKAGDFVEATYTEAVAINVAAAKK